MSKKEELKKTSDAILEAVGGTSNVSGITHCMTRLRFNLKDASIPDDNSIKKIKNVAGVTRSGGQYQVVIGPQVAEVYDRIITKLGNVNATASVENYAEGETIHKKRNVKDIMGSIFDYLAGSLTPLIPIFLAAALCKTVAAIIGPNLFNFVTIESDIYTLFNFIGDAGFYFLPIFIGWSAARKLNVSIPIALLLGAGLIHPTFMQMATEGNNFSVYGLPTLTQNYSSTVIPMLLIVWVMSYVEKWFQKHTPDTLKVFAIPFGTLVVMLPISFVVLAPLGGYLGQYVGEGIIALNDVAGPVAVAVVGATFSVLVLTGMHMVLMTYLFVTFPIIGFDNFLLPGVLSASWAGAGVALACMYKFKNQTNKKLTFGYLLTWLLGGVGEPLLYGLSVPYKTPLVAGAISGGIAGLVAGLLNLTAYVLNPSNGIYGIAAFIGGSQWNYIALAITIVVAVVSGFAVMSFMKLEESVLEDSLKEELS